MALEYTILGYLSWKPMSGYDLKKIIAESEILYWSANNNQIYRTLLKLNKHDLVTQSILHQEKNPSKKIYTITNAGRRALKEWVSTNPEAPQLRNTFLIQLQWSDQLSKKEISDLITKYKYEVQAKLLIQKEKIKRCENKPQRTSREMIIWDLIDEEVCISYENELLWLEKLEKAI